MITLNGVGNSKGVAMAQALIIQEGFDLADVPPTLLQQGLDALRRGYPEAEFPSVVLVCHAGSNDVKLPGIQIVAIATEAPVMMAPDVDVRGHQVRGHRANMENLPCVTEVDDLLRSVNNGDMVIVDGNLGIVYIDPDAAILAYYQNAEESQKEQRVWRLDEEGESA